MKLLTLQEIPDVRCDACLIDDKSALTFLSAWGRDTAIQELLAKITIGHTSSRGLTTLKFNETYSRASLNQQVFTKRSQRINTARLGSLIHVWIFDERFINPDQSNHVAMLLSQDLSTLDAQMWQCIKKMSAIPMLEHWQDFIINAIASHAMLTNHQTIVGNLRSATIHLDETILTTMMSNAILRGKLTILPGELTF